MTLLSEYALTPDVFDTECYPHAEVCTARLEQLKDVLLEEALLRNLHNGDWLDVFKTSDRQWHRRGLEILKKLIKYNRLRLTSSELPGVPECDAEWCQEALASHRNTPLTGVLSTSNVFEQVPADPFLGRIDRLGSYPGWTNRGTSVRLLRTLQDYKEQLWLVLGNANSVMFIDPHLDPSRHGYTDVLPLLLLASAANSVPKIEIHRVVYVGSGRNRQLIAILSYLFSFYLFALIIIVSLL